MSRQDHRDHDAALLAERSAQKETMAAAERKRKEKRDVAVAIILAAVTFVLTLFLKVFWAGLALLIGMFFLASYIGNLERMVSIQRAKIRRLQAVVIIVGIGLGFCLLYPFWREEQAAALEGDLFGSGGKHFSNMGTPFVQVGKAGPMIGEPPQEKVLPYFKPFPDAEFLVEGGSKGPLISTTIRDRFGNLVVEIKGSHWTVYPPYCSDKNYTKYAFEAKDSSGHVLLQIRYMPGLPQRIQVQGEWWNNEGRGVRVVENKGMDIIPLFPQNQHNDALIQEMFKYPSKKYWEKFAD